MVWSIVAFFFFYKVAPFSPLNLVDNYVIDVSGGLLKHFVSEVLTRRLLPVEHRKILGILHCVSPDFLSKPPATQRLFAAH